MKGLEHLLIFTIRTRALWHNFDLLHEEKCTRSSKDDLPGNSMQNLAMCFEAVFFYNSSFQQTFQEHFEKTLIFPEAATQRCS